MIKGPKLRHSGGPFRHLQIALHPGSTTIIVVAITPPNGDSGTSRKDRTGTRLCQGTRELGVLCAYERTTTDR